MTPPKPTGLPTPPSVRPPPELPTLKKKEEKEKKGGAGLLPGGAPSAGSQGSFLSRWLGVGGQKGASTLGKGAASAVGRSGLGAAGKLGFGPMLVNFLASNMAAVLFTGLVTGGAVYTLYSLGMSANAERPSKKSVFAQTVSAKAADGVEGRVDASGLSYFQTANQGGAFNEGLKTADAPAAEASDAPPAEETAPPAADAPADPGAGPQFADALAKHLEKPRMVSAKGMPGGAGLGGGNGLAGGAGLSGGMMKKFDGKAAAATSSQAMRRDPVAKLTARRVSPIRGAKGNAMQQLKFANKTSRSALGQTGGESQSFQAAEAFNTAPITQGAAGVRDGGLGDGGAGTSPGANDDGGPIGRTGEEPAPDTGEKKDKTPYGKQLMMAQALLMTASTIITIIGILAMLEKMPVIGYLAAMWKMILYGMAIGMAASASAIGAMVASQHGQKDQGMMVTIGGAITTAAATAALMMKGPESAWVAVLGGIAGIGASIGSALLPMIKGGGANGGSASGAAK